jgi:hypothetical protein
MSKRKKTVKPKTLKPKKINLLELSASKNTRILKEAQEKLQKQLLEVKFWQSLAETERVIINGQKINFENNGLTEFTPEELTGP